MIENLPYYISLIFVLATFATMVFCYWALKQSNSQSYGQYTGKIMLGILLWLIFQGVLAYNKFYLFDSKSFPPPIFYLGILPTILLMMALFTTKKGNQFMDCLPLSILTYLHMVRIPVELVLYLLHVNKAVPELMTFEGRNFDIIAGITSPFIAYFGFNKQKLTKSTLLLWNFFCLALLINIVANAFLSTPSPVQKFAFDQPNIAILHFPFVWLPTFIVPIVLLAHLVSIRKSIYRN